MKSEVKKINACLREINIEVGADRVKSKLDEVYSEISKKAKVPGFRPGAAPRQMLEEHHGQLANEELIKNLIPQVYEESLKEKDLFSYGPPEISDVSLNNNVLKFKAKVEVRPEIALNSYKGIKIKRKEPKASEEEVDKELKALAKERERENDINDNLARSLGYKTLDELKEFLKKQLFLKSQEESYHDAFNQIISEILKNNPVSVPSVLVKRQLERREQETKYRLKAYGQKEEEIEAKLKELKPQLEQACERETKIFLLLEEISKKENLKVKDPSLVTQRAVEFLFENAKWG